MNRFFQALTNLFRIEDLRKRVFFTLGLLAVYRVGAHIPTPGINNAVLDQLFQQAQGTALGIFDLFSGGTFRRMTIFALGIMPYITSSIILQLMTVVFPYLERLQKEGELGRRKITQYTRYLTIALSIIQSLSIAATLKAQSLNGVSLVYHPELELRSDDGVNPDHGLGFYHVAGRTDQRTRYRQWHVPHHLCGHRGRAAACDI